MWILNQLIWLVKVVKHFAQLCTERSFLFMTLDGRNVNGSYTKRLALFCQGTILVSLGTKSIRVPKPKD